MLLSFVLSCVKASMNWRNVKKLFQKDGPMEKADQNKCVVSSVVCVQEVKDKQHLKQQYVDTYCASCPDSSEKKGG